MLPKFGGSAGVWVTCMLFFQVMLLLGYLYSWLLTSRLSHRAQSMIHGALLLASVAFAAARPTIAWSQSSGDNPAWTILAGLLIAIGLPYFLLATTSPLLQVWLSDSAEFPWWLFAVSNAASLTALLAYPAIIEPMLPQSSQMHWWWVGYGLFFVLVGTTAITNARVVSPGARNEDVIASGNSLLWISLAACGSALWMAVANHLSQEVAPVPFLWVLPLSIYLLTFILCFEGRNWYRPALFRWLLPVAWICAGYQIAGRGPSGLVWEISIFSLALFIWCMFCHGEIARTRPESRHGSAWFYLMISLGGALGALFVGLAAPNLLTTYLELPIGIAASALLALRVLYGMTSPWRLLRLAVVALAAFVIATRFQAGFGDVIHLRNFYGALQVSDAESSGAAIRTLYNGKTLHGVEFVAPDKSKLPTAYYGPESGVGLVMRSHSDTARRVALVGLGVGTLAVYGHHGDEFRFYEINPAVIDVAQRYFHFLGTSDVKVDIREGDGRLQLLLEPSDSFDILVLDAFADDSIPVHLLTREAFQTYFRLLHRDGLMAVHVTNRFLELTPVVESAAASLGKYAVEVHNAADPERQVLASDWVLVSSAPELLRPFGGSTPQAHAVRLWTDDYSNLFQVLK